jgi:hypothetical protein
VVWPGRYGQSETRREVSLVDVDIKELQLLPGEEVGLIIVNRCTQSCNNSCTITCVVTK